jgi:hypothetical protein
VAPATGRACRGPIERGCLCAAVREYLRDSGAGERKGLAKCDQAVILVGQEKTDRGPMVTFTADAFRSEPGGKIVLTRQEALIIDGSEGVARISVRKVTAARCSGVHIGPSLPQRISAYLGITTGSFDSTSFWIGSNEVAPWPEPESAASDIPAAN